MYLSLERRFVFIAGSSKKASEAVSVEVHLIVKNRLVFFLDRRHHPTREPHHYRCMIRFHSRIAYTAKCSELCLNNEVGYVCKSQALGLFSASCGPHLFSTSHRGIILLNSASQRYVTLYHVAFTFLPKEKSSAMWYDLSTTTIAQYNRNSIRVAGNRHSLHKARNNNQPLKTFPGRQFSAKNVAAMPLSLPPKGYCIYSNEACNRRLDFPPQKSTVLFTQKTYYSYHLDLAQNTPITRSLKTLPPL